MSSASSVLELPATSCSSSALIISCSTASTMGITMAVVEVLESHMDSMVVQHMKHSSSLEGRDSGSRALSLLNCDPYDPHRYYSASNSQSLVQRNPLFEHWPSK